MSLLSCLFGPKPRRLLDEKGKPITHLVIAGGGGFAREVFWYAHQLGVYNILFVDEVNKNPCVYMGGIMYRVMRRYDDLRAHPEYRHFTIGVGDPALKEALAKKALSAGLNPAPTIIAEGAKIHDHSCIIGRGGVIAPGTQITTSVKIGDYVILNLNCTVGHDAVIENYVTANPGCQISGNVTLKEGVALGTGTAVIEKKTIAQGVITGAQACVVKDLNEIGTYVGVPVKKLGS